VSRKQAHELGWSDEMTWQERQDLLDNWKMPTHAMTAQEVVDSMTDEERKLFEQPAQPEQEKRGWW
jgi:hypothetical protein